MRNEPYCASCATTRNLCHSVVSPVALCDCQNQDLVAAADLSRRCSEELHSMESKCPRVGHATRCHPCSSAGPFRTNRWASFALILTALTCLTTCHAGAPSRLRHHSRRHHSGEIFRRLVADRGGGMESTVFPSSSAAAMAALSAASSSGGLRRRSSSSPSSSTTVGAAGMSGELLRQLAQAMKKYGYREPPAMTRTFLNNQSVTCNDGSPAGYYIRRSEGSSRWIVFLEGGWLCYDRESCEKRWQHSRKLMTSAFWEPTRTEDGILSPYPEDNPYWWNANHVYIPYCSSDCWSGSAKATRTKQFAFMGALIIQQTIKDLLDLGLRDASLLLLAGSSAGGTGAMLNVDRVRDALISIGVTKPQVRAITDSGWFLDNPPFGAESCKPPHVCTAVQSVQLGVDYWEGLLPDRCVVQYPTEKWRCYFGFRIYPTLRAPLFVFQWIFDQAQMQANNVGNPRSQDQWDYIYKSGDALRHTFQNVSAVFAPACVSHMILTSKDWVKVSIQGITLPKALKCWAHQPHEHNHHEHHPDHDKHDRRPSMGELAALLPPNYQSDYVHGGQKRFPTRVMRPEVRDMLADAPMDKRLAPSVTLTVEANRVEKNLSTRSAVNKKNQTCRRRKKRRHSHGEEGDRLTRLQRERQRRRERRRRERKKQKRRERERRLREKFGKEKTNRGAYTETREERRRRRRRERKKKCREERKKLRDEERKKLRDEERKRMSNEAAALVRARAARSLDDPNISHRWMLHDDICQHRLIDTCNWPMCNQACPPMTNPITGKSMELIDLLQSFGTDMGNVASALDIDIETLRTMDKHILSKMLTQSS